MALLLELPDSLRGLAGDRGELTLPCRRLAELPGAAKAAYPELAACLFDPAGRPRPGVRLYLNGEEVRHLDPLATPLVSGDVVRAVPVTAGAETPPSLPTLSPTDWERYSRHIILPEVGPEGQQRLKAASILLIGAGGLGSPAAMYLAAAGIGRIGLVDFDRVDASNLQRQILHGFPDVGRPKLDSAEDTLRTLNPELQIDRYETALRADNALERLAPYDVVIDGTDNFPTRYLVNDACVLLGKPNVYGSIFRFEGQASVFWSVRGPCYRCLYPEPPPPGLVPSCAEGGVFGVLPGVIGGIQATEAIKLILRRGASLIGRLLLYDALRMQFRELRLRKDPACPLCGENPTQHGLVDYDALCGIAPSSDPPADAGEELAPTELDRRLQAGEDWLLLDVREPRELVFGKIRDALEIPLGELKDRLDELPRDRDLAVYCRSGGRSRRAVRALHKAGFERARNLAGGVLAWSDQVDPSVHRY